ncbi:retroelement pol polyprotein-like [Arabidopsis thaliana]|uniref:Retroelement pol polyprotein-like n=1 Tax=Arabidopsis thaliana TaxID=3702 RepID=Q9LGZ8_ARATH|nr:retroelement pol polyprotein-like [Arabidopsis thaliana]
MSGAIVPVTTPSPYGITASDNPGALISSVILKEDNYSEWAEELMNSLQAKQKLGFLDGTIPKPTTEPALSSWKAANSMIIGWIRTSIDPTIRSTVAFVSDAKDLWDSLKQRFSNGNGVRKQLLKDEILACKQDGQSVLVYYGRLTKLWEELQNYKTSRTCTCEAAPDIAKEREDDKVHQFLLNLDERFRPIRSTITVQDPLPALNQVYSRVIHEEQNLNASRIKDDIKTEAVGFTVQATPLPPTPQVAAVSAPRFRDRSSLTCTHYHRQGHDITECFLVHGYPDWWLEQNGSNGSAGRGTSGRGNNGRGNNNRGGRSSSSGSRGKGRANAASTHPPPTSTPSNADQINQLISLLQAQNPATSSQKLSGKTFTTYVIIDTGASHHMTGDITLLTNVEDIIPSPVTKPDGTASRATKRGTLALHNAYVLPDVLFVPDFNCTLISVAKLLKHTGCVAIFTDTLCFLQDRFTRTLIGAGEEREGVYYFTGVLAARVNKGFKESSSATLWHHRLGHPSTGVLLSFPEFASSSSDLEIIKSCDICYRAKQAREVFSPSLNKTTVCFELIHCDVWGPYRTPASCGSVYFLTIVDDFSRSVWTFLMAEKSEVSRLIRNFCAMSERQFCKSIKTVHSDNGTEFMCLKSFFQEQGIIHQTSCVDTRQQNGRVERKHRHILNVARTCLFQSHLPRKFRGESILTAIHLINRTPTKILHGKSPYEVLFGSRPSYSALRTFGCLCYAHYRARDKDKFSERSRRCVFVGYPYGKKGWRLYDLEKNKFFVSRDVVFQETVFPYGTIESSSIPFSPSMFPPSTIFHDDDWLQPQADISISPTVDLSSPTTIPTLTTTSPPVIVTTPTSPLSLSHPMVLTPSSNSNPGSPSSPSSPLPPSSSPSLSPLSSPEASPGLPELLGKGHRQKLPSVLLKDFVAHHATAPSLTNNTPSTASSATFTDPSLSKTVCGKILDSIPISISDEKFSGLHRVFMVAITSDTEPTSYHQASQIKEWCAAMGLEITALEENHTWDITTLPPGKKAIGSKWVYKLKYNSDGTLERHKARLVALGNRQVEGSDFTETFAPVAKMTTVRFLLAVAAARQWEVHQMGFITC